MSKTTTIYGKPEKKDKESRKRKAKKEKAPRVPAKKIARQEWPPTAYEKMGFPRHDVLKSRFDRYGPQQLSDPLTPKQKNYLEICVDSAFKEPYTTSEWADPYFPGMDKMTKWFQDHEVVKAARKNRFGLFQELAVFESVEDAESDLQILIDQRPKKGTGIFGQPTPEDFQSIADELKTEQQSYLNILDRIELHKQKFVDFAEAENIDDDFEAILDLKKRNTEMTELIENLLVDNGYRQVSTTKVCDERIRLTTASDEVEKCEIGVQTDENDTEFGVRVKTENY